MTHNTGHNAFRNIVSNNNLLFAKTSLQSTIYAQTDATDTVFSLWGRIDSNWHARPMLQSTIIKAIKPNYNLNLNIGNWYALSTFDQHSLISPKTFSSTVNPDDSIRFEYNATNSVQTISLDKTYIDLKKNQYSGSVNLQPFTSLILMPVPIPPNVNVVNPVNDTSFIPPANVTINATASDPDGTINKVEFYNGNMLLGTSFASPYTYSWPNVSAGSYTITAKATDNDSLTTISSPVTISVNQPPAINIVNPVNNASFASPVNIDIDAIASDADGAISKIEFYNGNTLLGTSTVSPYAFTWTNVTSGNYLITAKAFDNGSLSTISQPINISVNEPPAVSIVNPINNTTFASPASITITANALDADGSISKVEFYNGNILLGTVSTSPYIFTWNNVPSGTYFITAKATDNGSLTTTSALVGITVNSAPSVSITNPASNTSIAAPAAITINALATDADGNISKVDFYSGNILLGTATTNPYSITWTNVTTGSYNLTAVATDNGGLSTISTPVVVSVYTPNLPPTVSITTPVNNSIFPSPASVSITATAADADGTITRVDFYNGSTLIGTANTSPYTIVWPNVPVGNYLLTAKAIDNGSLVTTSSVVAVLVNAPPTVSITSPANNAKYNALASITINATAADVGGSVTKVEFYNGVTLIGTDNTSPYSFSWTGVSSGTYSITAKATDNTLLTKTSAVVTVIVNTSPAVSITSPLNNAVFTPPATITIDASASDVDGTISKVNFYKGATLLGTDNTSPYAFKWSGVAPGSYSITAKATDNNSAVTTSSVVNIIVNASPTVSITSPLNNATFNGPANITIKASAADAGGSVSKVDFYNGGTLIGTDNTSPYIFSWTNVQPGSYVLTAKATDNTSLATTSTAVSTIVSGPPVVAITSPAINTLFTPPATIVINATASDVGGSVSKVDFYNGTTKLGSDATSPYSFTWSNIASGNYTLTAKATDNSSSITTSTAVSISVNKAPTVALTNPPNNANYAAPANMTLIAIASDPGGSISKVEFYNGSTLLGTDNTTPYSFNWNNVPIGTYTITAKATDNLGLSNVSTPVSVIVTQSITYSGPGEGLVPALFIKVDDE